MPCLSLFGQCTDSDGCAVDRAKAWCEMIDTIYYRSVYKKKHSVLLSLFILFIYFYGQYYY